MALGSIAFACGGDDPAAQAPAASSTAGAATTVVVSPSASTSSPAPPTTAPTTGAASTSVPVYVPAVPVQGPCDDGEFPAVGAVDLVAGAVGWVTCSDAEVWRQTYGVRDGLLVVAEQQPGAIAMVALDPGDGTERWRRTTSFHRIPAGPIVAADVIVLPAEGEGTAGAVGVEALTGRELWRIDEPLDVYGMNDVVVAVTSHSGGVGDEPLRGLDRRTGEEMWRSDVVIFDNAQSFGSFMPAAVIGDVILVPTQGGSTAVDLTDGSVVWTGSGFDHAHRIGDMFVTSGPEGPDSSLIGLDAATGEPQWEVAGRLSYGNLLAGGEGVVVALDPMAADAIGYDLTSGEERWRAPAFQPQLVVDGTLISLWEGAMAAWSVADGSATWSITEPFGTRLMNGVVSDGTTLFVAINSRPWAD